MVWKDVDFLFVDMPPGTGDVPLTVFQSLPVDGIVVVASPQELVSMIVAKAVNMAEMMKVPMLGIVENMSYIVCPDCGKHINVFGNSHVDEVAAKHHLPVLAKCPIDPKLARAFRRRHDRDLRRRILGRRSRRLRKAAEMIRPSGCCTNCCAAAFSICSCLSKLALSVTYGDSSPKGRALGSPR